MARVFDTLFAAFFGAVLGVFVAIATMFAAAGAGFFDSRMTPIPRVLAEQRLGDERAIAQQLGLGLVEQHDVGVGPHSFPLELAEGECVAAITTAWGGLRTAGVTITPRGADHATVWSADALGSHPDPTGLVSHAQWCAASATPVDVTAFTDIRFASTVPSGGRLLILRGRVDPASLGRGYVLPVSADR